MKRSRWTARQGHRSAPLSFGARWTRLVIANTMLWGGAACDRGTSAADVEIAAELRALRLALAHSAPAAPDAGVDAAQVLSPLREALDGMASEQRELGARQMALTQEVRHWTDLMGASMQKQYADQVAVMAGRLTAMEQAMAAQEQRHVEVEALLQRALDNTAERLEQFLRRVSALPADAVPAPAPASVAPRTEPASTPPPVPPGGDATAPIGPPPAGGDALQANGAAPPTRNATSPLWWWVLVPLAALAGWFALRGSAGTGGERARQAPVELGPVDEHAAARDTQELWAAAALLGEAVDRLRQSAAAQATVPAEDPPPPDAGQVSSPPRTKLAEAPGQGAWGDEESPEATGGASDRWPELEPVVVPGGSSSTAGAPARLADDAAAQELLDGDAVPIGEPACPSPLPHSSSSAPSGDVFELDDFFVLDDGEGFEPDPAPVGELPRQRATPTDRVRPMQAPRSAGSMPSATVFTLCVSPLTVAAAEGRVREVLAADPRVLIDPPPEVVRDGQDLQVRLRLLPGLPSGERAQVEQRLQDAVG